jgi:hypothetical protein
VQIDLFVNVNYSYLRFRVRPLPDKIKLRKGGLSGANVLTAAPAQNNK